MNLIRCRARKRRDLPRGAWTLITRSVLVRCPQCGRVFHLDEHTIASRGAVSPSVVCPFECGFHVTAALEEWCEIDKTHVL